MKKRHYALILLALYFWPEISPTVNDWCFARSRDLRGFVSAMFTEAPANDPQEGPVVRPMAADEVRMFEREPDARESL